MRSAGAAIFAPLAEARSKAFDIAWVARETCQQISTMQAGLCSAAAATMLRFCAGAAAEPTALEATTATSQTNGFVVPPHRQ